MRKTRWILLTVFLLILVFMVLSFAGCKSKNSQDHSERYYEMQNDKSAIPDIDWEDKIYDETIFEETAIDKAMADAIKIKVKDVTEENIVVKVCAPDIGEEIIAWYDTVPDEEFSLGAMEEEIIRLIKETKAEEEELTLSYLYKSSGEVVINYSGPYYAQIYCGLGLFYDYALDGLYNDVLGGEANANE